MSQVGGFCYLLNMIFKALLNQFFENTKSAYLINILSQFRKKDGGLKSSDFSSENQPRKEESKIGNSSPPSVINNRGQGTSYHQMKAEIGQTIGKF